MAIVTQKIGPISAYAIAKEEGYTGTKEQFATEIGNASVNAQAAAASATEAEGYATSAATSASNAMSTTPAGYNSMMESIAAEYDATATYAVGDYCRYNSEVYRCVTAISAAEAFDSTKWTKVTIGGQLSQLSEDLTELPNYCPIISTGDFTLGKSINQSTGVISDNPRTASTIMPTSLSNVKYIEWTGVENEDHSYHVFAYFYTNADVFINSATLYDSNISRKISIPSNAKYIRVCFAYYSTDGVNAITQELFAPYFGLLFTTYYGVKASDFDKSVLNLGNYKPFISSDDLTLGKSVNSSTGEIGDNVRAASTIQAFFVDNVDFIKWVGGANTDHSYHVFVYFYAGNDGTNYIGQRTLYDSNIARNVTVPEGSKTARICFVYYSGDGVTQITPALIDPYFAVNMEIGYEDSVIKTISDSVNANVDGNNIIFVHVTDSHVGATEMPHYRAVAHLNKVMTLAKAVNADFVIHTGDMIQGFDTAGEGSALEDRQNYLAYNSDIADYHIPFNWCQGNPWHDFGHRIHEGENTEYTLNRDIVLNFIGRFGKWDDKHFNDTDTIRSYYYFDMPLHKTRVIVLDTDDRTTDDIIRMNIGFSSEQIQWFSDTLTDAKTKALSVIVFSHIALLDRFNYSNSTIEGRGGTQIVNAMKSFIAGGGTLCECVSGHTHADAVETVEGINYVVSACDVPINYSASSVPTGMTAPQRVIDTLSEYCCTVHVVNPATGTVKLYRYGAGNTNLVFPTEQF